MTTHYKAFCACVQRISMHSSLQTCGWWGCGVVTYRATFRRYLTPLSLAAYPWPSRRGVLIKTCSITSKKISVSKEGRSQSVRHRNQVQQCVHKIIIVIIKYEKLFIIYFTALSVCQIAYTILRPRKDVQPIAPTPYLRLFVTLPPSSVVPYTPL